MPITSASEKEMTMLPPAEIKTSLLNYPEIKNCAVLERETNGGDSELVVYVVPAKREELEQLQSDLRTLLPTHTFVPLLNLPLTDSGEVDQQALLSQPVLDADLVQQWERELQALAEIDQVAVVVQEAGEKPPALHLSDLLPDWQRSLRSPNGKAATERAPISAAPSRMAIVHGAPLQEDANAATTLPEILVRASDEAVGQSIIYLDANGAQDTQSYAALLKESEQVLAGLRQLGLQRQDKVIFQLEYNRDILAAFWGCLLGGFIPVITAVPPTYRESNSDLERLKHVWQMLEQSLILTSARLEESVQVLSQWLPPGEDEISTTIERLRENAPDKNHHASQPTDVAFFSLTSGSTGAPKCIQLTHRNILSRARGTIELCGDKHSDVILNWLPLDHIGSISDWHIRGVVLGCQHVYAPKGYILGNPLNWLHVIDKYGITHSWAPNFAYALINDALKESSGKWDLSTVQSLLTAGESVSPQVIEAFIENLVPYGLKRTAIRPAFGMAEMGSGVTYFQPTPERSWQFHTVDRASLGKKLLYVSPEHPNSITLTSLGPPIAGISIRIVNSLGQLLPEETVGHFHVKGDPVSPGYYQNPAANEVFLADGWFDTGDLGFISNGELVITGRAKESIIINGANYYNGEIEAVVEEVEGVRVSYTAACAVRTLGNVHEELAIFFSPSEERSHFDENYILDLMKNIRQRVVKRIGIKPHYLIPVEPEVIPKTAIGKIQRIKLARRFEAGEFDETLKQIDLLMGNEKTIPQWFYRKMWRRKKLDIDMVRQPFHGQLLIFHDGLGLGRQLSSELANQAQAVVSVERGPKFARIAKNHYRINPHSADDYRRLIEAVTSNHNRVGPITQILHLWNVDESAGEVKSVIALEEAQTRGVYSLLFLVQALAEIQGDTHAARLLVGGSHTQAVLPTDKIAYEKAPLLGLLKTIPSEMPWLTCCHVDLPVADGQRNITYLLRECLLNEGEQEVAYRQGSRWVPRLEKVTFSAKKELIKPFKEGGMYLISGGLGGIGEQIATHLLEHYRAKLLLVGRTPLLRESLDDQPLETAFSKLAAYQRLRQLSGEVLYKAADVCDLTRIQQIVEWAQCHWQCELDGVIHLAGVTRECSLVEESREGIATTLRAKMIGGWVLHQLVKHQPQTLFISFSSASGFFGGWGNGAYAAANCFLDALSHYQRHTGSLRSFSFAWSMWDEIGMSRESNVRAIFRAKGLQVISAKQGINSLCVGLHYDQSQILIGLDGSKPFVRQYIERDSVEVQELVAYITAKDTIPNPSTILNIHEKKVIIQDRFGTATTCTLRLLPKLPMTRSGEIDREALVAIGKDGNQATDLYVAPRTPLERQLAGIWQEVLGLSKVGIHHDFFELGGDSLKGASLINKLQEEMDDTFHVVAIFNASTVAKLAVYLEEQYPEAVAKTRGLNPNPTTKTPFKRIQLDDLAELRRRIPKLPPLSQTPSKKNPSAIFVLSAPRSGSTLFRIMLAGHPRLFSPPELLLLPYETLAEREMVLTGENSIWREGVLKALTNLKGVTVEEAEAFMLSLAEQGLTIQQFYALIQEELDGRILIDKSPLYTMDLNILKRAETYFQNPIYIHLIRHPSGVMRSFEKARIDQLLYTYMPSLRGAHGEHTFTTQELGELIWLLNHQNILDFLKDVPLKRQYCVSYEELVTHPGPVMEGVCQFLGVDFDEEMLQPYKEKEQRMTTGLHDHDASRMLGDIKFHQHQAINAEQADRWKQEIKSDFLGDLTWQVAESLGYERLMPTGNVPVLREASTAPSDWIVCLKPNPEARLRLFCFAHAGGSASLFRTWSSHLPSEIEVCAIQLPGRENRLNEHPFSDLSSLTETLSDVLQPYLERPFALFGHSIGALIAFELARTLRRKNLPTPNHFFVSARRAPDIPNPYHDLSHLPDRDLIAALKERWNAVPERLSENNALMQLMLPTWRADFQMSDTYVYTDEEPLDCPITAFGGLQDWNAKADELAGWRRQTNHDFNLHFFDGDHFYLRDTEVALLQIITQEERMS